ncbi:hypothetical protein PV325_000587 [Microctonus aethiopoides]|uniref:Uncharacterized protein n=1 Tax=Microctonus aethiopoides TaxID=144406 RepID=A0AA39FZH9_9HYME|nr:hypothetical protein PV325_000587 [Microctonus aethiopoides]KAK0178325.1 hypothetical protein PV328_002285 [Microctonus aethiopoides]
MRHKHTQWIAKYINLSVRGMADHGSKNRKLPIHDPNSQKEKMSSISENKGKRHGMKIDWGVKLSDEQIETEQNIEENFPKYVLKQKWGVNLLEPMKLEKRQATIKNEISRFDSVMQSNKNTAKSLEKTEMKIMKESPSGIINLSDHSSILPSTPDYEDTLKSLKDQELKYQMNHYSNINNSKEFSKNSNNIDNEDIPWEIDREDEIIAWQNVIIKTREHNKKMADAKKLKTETDIEELEIKFSILPEPPRPKLDIAAVKSTELYSLIDSYMDPSEPPTAKGLRIALYQVNNKKYSNNRTNKNQSSYQASKSNQPN